MTDAAIIEAEYVEWKMVKTRKALQLIFEVPLELQARVQEALGTPMPDTSTPVAIARLRLPSEPQKAIEGKTSNLAQRAGILCNEPLFQTYMRTVQGYDSETAEAVRLYCGIESRKELDTDVEAAALFNELRGAYDLWARCDA